MDSSADKNSPDYFSSTYISKSQLPDELKIKERDSDQILFFSCSQITGTYTPEKKLQEEIPSDTEKDSEEISMVDVDASLVDSEISDTMQNKNTEEELGTSEKEESLDTQKDSMQTNMEKIGRAHV